VRWSTSKRKADDAADDARGAAVTAPCHAARVKTQPAKLTHPTPTTRIYTGPAPDAKEWREL